MAAFIVLLLLVVVAATGFAARRWLSLRKDNSKKQEELDADGVEIVVQKPERRLKLALPDISSIQIRSPVGPMKSSIRSALKELRSRQMVQSLCSRFESRMKVASEDECKKEATKKQRTETAETAQSTRARRRDARDGRDATVAPILLASELAKEAEITANARSNNLSKFLRSYASNLDNAVSAERRVSSSTDAISVERRVVMSTDAEDDVEQPLLANVEEIEEVPTKDTAADSDDSNMELELDLHTLKLESEFSNQVDSPSTADSEAEMEVSVLVESTDCEPSVDESFGESDEGNNNVGPKRSAAAFNVTLSKAFTPADSDKSSPESTRSSDTKPETCADPPAKLALSRFKQQVPPNGRRACSIATLNI